MTTTHTNQNGSNTMNRIARTIVTIAAAILAFGTVSTLPAQADTGDTYVDTFVVPDPSIGGCDIGNGISFTAADGVAWTVNGEPYTFTPQSRTLWLPNGFTGTVTATSTIPGVQLYELSANRRGASLTWEHVVTANAGLCSQISDLASQGDALTAQVDALTAELSVTKAKVERQRATIQRLRDKLAQR